MCARFAATYFGVEPYDGPFQLFNPLERIHLGQLPVRDFVEFHGLSLLFIHYPVFALLGHNLFASEFARGLLSPIAWIAAMGVLSYAVTGSKRVVLYALMLFSALACALTVGVDSAAYEIAHAIVSPQPGPGLMPLRWAYPAVCGAVLVCVLRSDNVTNAQAAIVGVAFGLAPSWSFDHGSFAVAAALGVFTVWSLTIRSRLRGMVLLLTFVSSLITMMWLGFELLTGGHGLQAMRFAFLSIPQNQGWYFGAPPNPVLALLGSQMPYNGVSGKTVGNMVLATVLGYLLVICFLVALLIAAVVHARRAKSDLRMSLGMGFLAPFALLSGAPLSGYVWVSYLFSCAHCAAIAIIGFGYSQTQHRPRVRRLIADAMVVTSCVALIFTYTTWYRSRSDVPRPLTVSSQTVKVSGVLPLETYRSLLPSIEKVRSVENSTVFSTYRGMLDIATGQTPQGRSDYIIHAFDDEEHKKYVETFVRGGYTFAQTIRPTWLIYEEWLQTTHWDFYKPLIKRYAVVGGSEFSLLWEKRAAPLELRLSECTDLSPDTHGMWLIRARSTPAFLQLTARYEIRNPTAMIPVVGGVPRYLLQHEGLANRLAVSLNPHHTSTSWLVRTIIDKDGWITPRLYSILPGVKFTVKAMSACEIEIPVDALPAFTHLMADSGGR